MHITAPPPVPSAALLRRDAAVDTCGFISGDEARPITCPTGLSCYFPDKLWGRWWCCDSVHCVDSYSACANFGQQPTDCSGYSTSYCTSRYNPILTCPEASPTCITFKLASSFYLGDFSTISYGCGTASTTIMALFNATGRGDGSAGGTGPGPWIGAISLLTPLSGMGTISGTGSQTLTQPTGTSTSTSTSSNSRHSSYYQWVGLGLGLLFLFAISWGIIRRVLKHRERNRPAAVQPYYPPQPPPPMSSVPQFVPPPGSPHPPTYNQAMTETQHRDQRTYDSAYGGSQTYGSEYSQPLAPTEVAQRRETENWVGEQASIGHNHGYDNHSDALSVADSNTHTDRRTVTSSNRSPEIAEERPWRAYHSYQ